MQTDKAELKKMIATTHITLNIQSCSSSERNMLKNTCEAAKIKFIKNTALQVAWFKSFHFEKNRLILNFTRKLTQAHMRLTMFNAF